MIDRATFRDAMARLRDVDALDIWPSQIGDANGERRVRFRADPFNTFLQSDDETQERIVAAMLRRNA